MLREPSNFGIGSGNPEESVSVKGPKWMLLIICLEESEDCVSRMSSLKVYKLVTTLWGIT